MKVLLFTLGLTYGGAVVSLFNPFVGLLIYVCFAIVRPDILWSWGVPPGNYSRIVAIAMLIGWVLNGCGSWKLGRARGIAIALAGYWIVLVLSAAGAPNQTLAWDSVEALSKVILPVLVGMTLVDSVARLKQLAWVIVLSQGYLAYEFNVIYYTNPFWTASDSMVGGMDNNCTAITMVTGVGMAFFLGLHAERWWQKLVAFALAALMAHVVLFSHSRGGMVALILTGCVTFLLIPKRPRDYLVFALALLLVLRLAGHEVQERFSTIFQPAEEGVDQSGGRLKHWQACWDSALQNPLGIGLAHWPLVAPQYGLPLNQAGHSTWFQTLAEIGFPGLLCLALYYLLCIRRLARFTRDKEPVEDPWFRYFARMVIASLAGFLVAAQFVTFYGVELPYYVVLVGVGVLKLTSARPETAPHPEEEPAPEDLAAAAVA